MRLPMVSGDWVFLFKMQSSTYSERICEILPKLGKVEFPFSIDRKKSLLFVQLLTVFHSTCKYLVWLIKFKTLGCKKGAKDPILMALTA